MKNIFRDGNRFMKEKEKPKRIHYYVFEETVFLNEYGFYRSYGLQGKEKRPAKTMEIHDVTTNRSQAKQMARLFQKHQLALVHFHDVVEDMLS